LTDVQQGVPAEALPAEEVGAGGTATVGRQLRAAREAAGLTTADVAQSLKFSQRQVESLEADDYDALPGTTIVRGFARSYARLLGLDTSAVLRLLDARTPNVPVEVKPPDNMGLAGEPGGLRQMSWLASASIVIALAAVLIGLWLYFSPGQPAIPFVTDKEPVASAGPAVDVAAAPQGISPVVPVAVASGGLPEGGTVASPEVPIPSEPPAPNAPRLLFSFEDKSWLEVSDAARQVLHSGENPAGSRLELTGKPPFDVVVGNAGRVKVSYGEREIDLAPHTRADVARLRIE
jgi:cytoskeleton protein RodZ